MAIINVAKREIHCKIVYYGCGFCGKTTNLLHVHNEAPPQSKGDLLTLATETERTLFFDFLPLDLGTVQGYKIRFHLYTVPGQPMYERTRVTVLTGLDGVVFVIDSQRSRFRDNVVSFLEMQRILEVLKKPIGKVPLVFQYNKRDMPEPVPVPVLNARYNNRLNAPYFEAVASRGVGVFNTLRAVSKSVIDSLVD
jgi:signal recognition particle receptor subunit beta